MSRSHLALLFSLGLLAGASGRAADTDDAKQLQALVAKAADQFEKLFGERDAKGLAALFTTKAEYVTSQGTVFHGRDAIQAEYTASFAQNNPGKLAVNINSIRPIAEGVIVEEGVSVFTPADGGAIERTSYSAMHVKQSDGTWLLASIRELDDEQASPHERLKDLAWLIGEWREEVDGTSINTKWDWSKDGNYLVSEFTVKQARDRGWHGTHRIGWDAERKQFRSWIFESSGGTGDGSWSADDAGWTVSMNTVNVMGVRSSSLLHYQPDGKDAIVVTQSQRVRAGVNLPGSEHRVVRQPPVPTVDAAPAKAAR